MNRPSQKHFLKCHEKGLVGTGGDSKAFGTLYQASPRLAGSNSECTLNR